jgi:Putative zinc-finger
MNCKELIHLLEDYLSGSMDEQLKRELDVHISMCEPCLHFLETYDKTRILCRQVTLDEIPPELRERLRSFVLEKARERRKGIEKYLRRETKERHDQAVSVVNGYLEKRLSPQLSRKIEGHRNGCERCGEYFETLDRSGNNPELCREVEVHLMSLLEDLPAGEPPFRS